MIATPKWSVFSPFYRASGVSGQLGPFFLETLLNPDLTGPERPAVLAHEWAHLSGYAPESDASFVGLLAALGAGPAAEYSAWLDLVSESVNQLQPVTQRLVLQKLAQGPRDDQAAIRERLKALVRPVEQVAWSSYDRMLKSQGVEEGVQELQPRDSVADRDGRLADQDLRTQDLKTSGPVKTRVIEVDRDRPDPAAIEEAAQALRDGKLVVFPTETVYGLGAHALDPVAVQKIFDAKERPANDPLIVHLAHIGQVNQCAVGMPAGARKLGLVVLGRTADVDPAEETRGARSRDRGTAKRRAARAVASRRARVDGDGRHSDRGAERESLLEAEPDDRRARHRRSRRPRRLDSRRRAHRHRIGVDHRRFHRRSAGAAAARRHHLRAGAFARARSDRAIRPGQGRGTASALRAR